MNTLLSYTKYKNSNITWIRKIPYLWKYKKLKYISIIKTGYTPNTTNNENFSDNGTMWIKPEDLDEFNLIINSKEKISKKAIKIKNLIPVNSIVVNCIGTIGKFGILGKEAITNQQINAIIFYQNEIVNKFGFFLIFSAKEEHYRWSNGNVVQILNVSKQGNIYFPIPPIKEQEKIANYLEQKAEQINKAITQKKELIQLLKEHQQILINDAITKGIDNSVQFKESNIQWLGEVPKHWEIRKGKYLFVEVDERSKDGKEELLSVSHMTGVTPRSEKNVTMFMSEDYTGSKTCQKDDLVINIMWAWMGALGVSDREGIVSSSYGIYRQRESNTFNSYYLEYLLRTNDYIAEYNRRSTGLHVSRLRLYSDMFLDMKIATPPIKEQNAIINFIKENNSKINKAINIQEQQIKLLEELKETLIDSCVTGKVKVP